MKTNKKTIIAVAGLILLGTVLGLLYSQIVILQSQDKFKDSRNFVNIVNGEAKFDLTMSKDAYLLRIKHNIKYAVSNQIRVNGLAISPNIHYYVRKRGQIETFYFYLTRDIIKTGVNSFGIRSNTILPFSVDFILTNCRKNIKNYMYVLFSDSTYWISRSTSFSTVFLAAVSIILFFLGIIYLLNQVTILGVYRLFCYQLLSILPFLVFLTILWLGNISGSYKIVISRLCFTFYGILSFFIIGLIIVLIAVWNGGLNAIIFNLNPQVIKLFWRLIDWIETGKFRAYDPHRVTKSRQWLLAWIEEKRIRVVSPGRKLLFWLKTRKFVEKCILFFIFLLVLCAILLFFHLNYLADKFAIAAYFAIIVVIITEAYKTIKHKETKL